MSTLKDLIRDDIREFLKSYEFKALTLTSEEDAAEELLEEIMQTISEKVVTLLK